jgi:succinoglycan biosynthesis transport protein ExoP
MSSVRKTPSSRSASEKEATPLSLDYGHLSRLCAKHWKWLALAVVLGLVGGFLYANSQTAIYSAQSSIVVESKDSGSAGVPDAGRPDNQSGDMLNTFVKLLQTRNLPELVVKSEQLNENPQFLPKGLSHVSADSATDMLWDMTTIRSEPSTRLIYITVEHPSPQMAQMLANKLAEESIVQDFNIGSNNASDLRDHLKAEADQLRQKVEQADENLQQYRLSHKDDSTDPDGEIAEQRLKDLNAQLSAAEAQVTAFKDRYGPEHPKLIEAQEEVTEIQDEVTKAQIIADKERDISIPYKDLESVAASYKAQYEGILQELRTTEVSTDVAMPGISVADRAELPMAPIRPNKKKAVLLGGLIGLVCGLGFIVGLYFVDSSLRTVSQAESALGLPVLAAVPILTETDGKSILPTFSDPQSFVAESFRGLRASLLLHDREHPLKAILVASAIPGEGKSFCAANLAVAFAQTGLRTLLIDADLRLPTIHTYFNLPAGQISTGFTDVLEGSATLASAVLASPVPNLSLLLTTAPADSPAELLSGARLNALLDEALLKYDRLVIDTAPLNAVSDTMLIVQKTDAILLVIRASSTPAGECKSALEKISGGKMKPLGLILNYLAPHSLKSYSYGFSYGQ